MIRDEIIKQAREAHRQGELEAAEELYRQVLNGNPDDPDANHFLGVIHYQREEYDAALDLIGKAVAARPAHAPAVNNLGSVQKALGMYREALDSLTRAIALKPDFAEACNNLGTVYRKIGQAEKAEAAYLEAVRHRPGYIKALNNLGNLCQGRGDYAQSLNWYGKALAQEPDLPLTNYNLGCALVKAARFAEGEAALLKALAGDPANVEVLKSLGMLYMSRLQHGKAIRYLRRLSELQPDSAESYINLGNAYLAYDNYQEASRLFKRALELVPDSTQALNNLAMLYNRQGKFSDAEHCLAKAHALSPDNVAVLSNMASMKMFQGDMSDAVELCREAVRLKPDFSAAYYQLAQLVPPAEGGQLASEISALLAASAKTPAERVQLHFAMGKLSEDQLSYAQAFQHYFEANRLKRSTMVYSLDSQRTVVDRTIGTYDQRIFAELSGKGCGSEAPIFIVGMPRSGTTLAEQIISSHPDVHGAGELPYIHETLANYLQLVHGEFFVPAGRCLSADDLYALGSRYVEKILRCTAEAPHITDKMPGNFMYLGLINLMLPKAKIIHCVRNPLDTCFSIFRKFFTYGHPWAYDLEELGAFYLMYERLMQHWREVLPGKFYDLSYEKLVYDQVGETAKLLQFCGLDWRDECLFFHENRRPVNTASSVQVRQPMTSSSIGQWKKYEAELQPLLALLRPLSEKRLKENDVP